MPDLSNLLRQRLGDGPGGGTEVAASLVYPDCVHPDADTLTAYVEQLLPSVERKNVVTHLSVCALCREVVALSLPQLPEIVAQGQSAVPASPWRRLWTPGFRWAGAMAVVAIAAALVIELPRHQGAQSGLTQPQGPQPVVARPEAARPEAGGSEVASDAHARDLEQAKAASNSALASSGKGLSDKSTEAASLSSGASRSAAFAPQANTRSFPTPDLKDIQPKVAVLLPKNETGGKVYAEEAKNDAKPPVLIAGTAKQDYVNNDLFAATDVDKVAHKYDNLPQAPIPQLGSSQPGLAAGPPQQIAVFQGIPATANKKPKFISKFVPLSTVERLGCDILCKVVDVAHLTKPTPSSPAITTGAVTYSAMDVHGELNSSLLRSQSTQIATAPEKSAGSELERSEGFTRRAAAAVAPAAKSRESASAQLHWRVADGKLFKSLDLNQWQDAYPRADADFEFSFVAAHGADVWAGGSHAALLHSRDGGALWENVKLGDSASGTIVSIVANGLNVQVKTSDNQSWLSSDAGKTWALQSGQE
jgi:hypothetical protein